MFTPDQIKHMVDRFLQWKLPADFSPDGGIKFEPLLDAGGGFTRPVGTNLLSAVQATDMVLHMIEGMPQPMTTEIEAAPAPRDYKLTSKDKTDIVMALREAARGIEQDIGGSLALQVMQAIGTELLVLALKSGPMLDEISGENAPEETREFRATHLENLIRLEIAAVADTVAAMHERRIKETDVIAERLFRMFDPTLAFNEAINRAIEAKKAAGLAHEIVSQTPQQRFMWEKFQYPGVMNALRNAGDPDPKPTVFKIEIENTDIEGLKKALAPKLLPK